jgi:UPF0176 protein
MNNEHTIILYYKYTPVDNPDALLLWHKAVCESLDLKGRIIIAGEGINGTLEGTTANTIKYRQMLKDLNKDPKTRGMGNFSDIQFKESVGTGQAFPKLKIKVRPEIVSLHLGEDDVDPRHMTGKHLPPKELKKWYENKEDFVIVDMRNDYEFDVGHFKNSINPQLENFRDLPKKLDEIANIKDKKVLTVCTGGVRCEKASGYLIKKGFKDVYQLDGGMHKYMEAFPGEDFLGALYTFDGRVVMDFGGDREIVGTCKFCNTKTEAYENCARSECNARMLCCEKCLDENGRPWCSARCKELASSKVVV